MKLNKILIFYALLFFFAFSFVVKSVSAVLLYKMDRVYLYENKDKITNNLVRWSSSEYSSPQICIQGLCDIPDDAYPVIFYKNSSTSSSVKFNPGRVVRESMLCALTKDDEAREFSVDLTTGNYTRASVFYECRKSIAGSLIIIVILLIIAWMIAHLFKRQRNLKF